MGIRYLTKYVEKLPHGEGKVWDNFDLRETKVVIDGNGLYHYIYSDISHLNTKYGGQYGEFQEKVKEFFENLRSNNVEPYVVIDGIMSRDEKKLETHIKRKREIVKQVEKMWKSNNKPDDKVNKIVLPLLAQLVFVQVLRDMEVQYAVADFEADWEIASLANELKAPVMGKDSDFYIFNINHGYIPFQHDYFTVQNTTVKKFSFDGFARHLAIKPKMLPLLASLAGNDYISDDLLSTFNSRKQIPDDESKVEIIAQFLSPYQSIYEAHDAVIELYQNDNDSAEFADTLSLSIEEYQKTESNLISYFKSASPSCNVRTYNGHPLPQWLVKLYRKGLIASEGLQCLCNRKVSLRPQSERISLPSTHTCAEGLRQYYYKLALSCEVNTTVTNTTNSREIEPIEATSDLVMDTDDIVVIEYDREGSTFVSNEKRITLQTELQIHDLPPMSENDRRIRLLTFLDPDLQPQPDLSIEHELVVSALKYWCRQPQTQIKREQLAAILVHYVGEEQSKTESDTSKITVYEVHGFSQWQTVLYWVERLSALLSFPFPKLVKLYDGVRVCLLYQTLRKKGIGYADNIVTNKTLYRNLYERVTKDLGSDWQIKQPQRSQKQQNKGRAKSEKERKTKGESSEGSCKNPFEFLGDQCDDDDEYDESC